MTWSTVVFLLCSVWLCIFCQALPSREHSAQRFRVVCVHASQSFYRLGSGKFTVEDIDPKLCTHLVYAYARVQNDQVRALDGYLDLESDFGKGNYKKFNDLREDNPHLTTLLSVGGKDEGAIKFSELSGDASKRKTFVQSCLETVRKYGFDGMNLDWQFPAHRGGIPEDKTRFTTLLQMLRAAFDKEGYVLTATLGAKKEILDDAYEVDKISKLVDFLIVLTYDYKQSSDRTTGLTSALYPGSHVESSDNADFSIQYLIKKGAPPEKLVPSASCYGQTWTLKSLDAKSQSPGSEASEPGQTWPYTREAGTIGYNEFCESQKEVDWCLNWLDTEKASFASAGDQWISYDSAQSVAEKSRYVVDYGLGGLLLYGIESDDGKGLCSQQTFPLLRAANQVLRDGRDPTPTPTTPTPSTTTQSTTTTTSAPDNFVCTRTGYFRHPKDCTKYYQCINSGRFSKVLYDCPPGTYFNQNKSLCDWRHNVTDCA